MTKHQRPPNVRDGPKTEVGTRRPLTFLPTLQQHRLVLSFHLGCVDVSDDFAFVACGCAPIKAGRGYDLCSEFFKGDRITNELF
jgi:hypothetical protein